MVLNLILVIVFGMGIGPAAFYGEKIAIVPMDFYYPGKGKSGDLPPRKFMAEYHDEVVRMIKKSGSRF